MPPDPAASWKPFLDELDSLLDERFELHCIGGFAVVAAYGLPRSTNDLDYVALVPRGRMPDLEQLAGQGSPLARRHKVHVHYVGVATVPEGYSERTKELFRGHFKNIRLFVLDPYDLILSKLSRNAARDREDLAFLAKKLHLHAGILRERYEQELKFGLIGPLEKHDQTLEFWIEAYFARAGASE